MAERRISCNNRQGKNTEGGNLPGCETGVQNEANRFRGYGVKGKAPALRVPVKRTHISMISAITNEGKVRFMVYEEAMTQQELITFMRRPKKDAGRMVCLFFDSLRPHHGRIVAEWRDEHKNEIIVFYLPLHTPEMNPDECLMKTAVHASTPPITGSDLRCKTQCFMRILVKGPYRVQSYFRHPEVVYAQGTCSGIKWPDQQYPFARICMRANSVLLR